MRKRLKLTLLSAVAASGVIAISMPMANAGPSVRTFKANVQVAKEANCTFTLLPGATAGEGAAFQEAPQEVVAKGDGSSGQSFGFVARAADADVAGHVEYMPSDCDNPELNDKKITFEFEVPKVLENRFFVNITSPWDESHGSIGGNDPVVTSKLTVK